jgi:hypothetical protein
VADAGHEHSWRFDGDDPYVLCDCGERRDALTGRIITRGTHNDGDGGEAS